MPTIDNTATATDLANEALGMLGLDTISSIEDTDRISSIVRRAYVRIRDEVLRRRPWNCAVTRQALAETANPSEEYDYAFALPTDPYCLRVLRTEGNNKFRLEGRILLTNADEVTLVYIARLDAHEMDAMLFSVVAMELAATLAGSLVRDPKMVSAFLQFAGQKMDEAAGVDDAEQADCPTVDLLRDR